MMKERKLLKIISLFVLFVFVTGIIGHTEAYGANNLQATGSGGKEAEEKITVESGHEFTVDYSFTPQTIKYNDIKNQIGNNKEIVLVIDTSAKMNDKIVGNGRSKLDVAKSTANKFIDKYKHDSNVKIAVVKYNDKAEIVKGLSSADTSYKELENQIKGLSAENGANLGDGLRKAYYLLKNGSSTSSKHIVLMSGSDPTAYTVKLNSTIYTESSTHSNLPYILSSDGKKTYFEGITHYTYETDNSDYADYVSYYGYEENEESLNYATSMASMIKEYGNIDTSVVSLALDGTHDELKGINAVSNILDAKRYYISKQGDVTDGSKNIYDNINSAIPSTLTCDLKLSMTLPIGIEPSRNVKDLNFNNNTRLLNGTVGQVIYKLHNSSDGKEIYYEADTVKFSLINKGSKVNNDTISEERIMTGAISYSIGSEQYKSDLKKVIVTITYVSNLKADLGLKTSLSPERDNNEYKLNEVFNINYTIDPSKGISKDDYDKLFKKEKDIVVVVDNSWSMDEHMPKQFTVEKKDVDKTPLLGIINSVRIDGKDYDVFLNLFIKDHDLYKIEEYKENKTTKYLCTRVLGSSSKMDVAKESLKSIVNKFKDYDNVKIGLVTYNTKAKVLNELDDKITDRDIEDIDGINSFKELKDVLSDLGDTMTFIQLLDRMFNIADPGGTSNLGDGLRKAYYMLKNSNKDAEKYIVLLTDGEPTAYSVDSLFGGNFVTSNKDKYYWRLLPKEKAIIYAKEIVKMINDDENLGINSYFIGYELEKNINTLKNIANGYKRTVVMQVENANDISKIFDDIIGSIPPPTLKNISFEARLPEGITAEGVTLTSSPETNLKNFTIEEGGRKVTGTIDNVVYDSLESDLYKFNADNLYKLQFTIKVRGNKTGNYMVGNKDNPCYITYTDVDGSTSRKDFPEVAFTVIEDKSPINIDKFGIFKGGIKASIEEYVQSGSAVVLNGFSYDLASIVETEYKDKEEIGKYIDKAINLKITTSGIDFVGNTKMNLYSIKEDGKLENIKSWNHVNNGEIKIEANLLQRGKKYILTQDFIPYAKKDDGLAVTITNNIVINDDIDSTKTLDLIIKPELPDLD